MVYSKYTIQDGYKPLDKWCISNTGYNMTDTKLLINGTYSKYTIQDGYKALDRWCITNTGYRTGTKHLIDGVLRIHDTGWIRST